MPQIKRLPRGVDDDEGDEDRSEDADEKEIRTPQLPTSTPPSASHIVYYAFDILYQT
jgi:hypothetical protein